MTSIDINKHVVTLFLEQVKATPDAPALEDQRHAYTYAELDEKVSALARFLRSQGIDQENLVGILLPHSADFIIACLATLRAGGAYLILELAYPPDLLNDVIQDANPHFLITYRSQIKNIKSDSPVLVLDDENDYRRWCANLYADVALPTEYDQDVMTFVSYSSGTTGRPKGIVNNDRPGILSYAQRFAISDQGPGDRIACNTFFIWEMFRPLIRGAMSFAVPDEISYDPVRLVGLLASRRISETLMTPTLLASILAHFPDNVGDHLPDLRVLWITGEVVTTDLTRRALKSLPKVRLLNSYSTSETWDTAVGEMKDILHDAQHSMYCSVGHPLGVNQIYILDENGNRLEQGKIGEIFIGGPVLALGYLYLPEVTAKTFLPDPFSPEARARMYRSGDLGRILPSGTLEITGRVGAMIKLRGYSIVPAQVQMAIIMHLAVRDCAVVSHADGLERQLIAYFVQDGASISGDRPAVEVDGSGFSPVARRRLLPYLAAYMIPTYWIEVARLPADPVSGKIDKKKLPPLPNTARSTGISHETTKARQNDINVDSIAQVWASTLKIPRSMITSKHTFFDLGGHSLLLSTLSKNLMKAFSYHIPLTQLADPATLDSHLAKILAIRDGINAGYERQQLVSMLRADCLLEEEIQAEDGEICYLKAADVVLLTGATGFLGAFLLHDLLQETTATILCLVRGAEGRARIQQNLLEKCLWRDHFMERIEVIKGDLSQKYFGLSFDSFKQLADRVKVVFHAGASVNLVYPYTALRGPNVIGTREILRLASLGEITVHYISSNSVFSSSVWPWNEDCRLGLDEIIDEIRDGYGQTKWVAEQLVFEAIDRGLPVHIYRAGTISGHSVTGVSNARDLLTALIVESIELGHAPEVEGWHVEMTPVDFVSKAIICLSNTKVTNSVFHLGNPRAINSDYLFCHLHDVGFPTKRLKWDTWVALWTETRALIESDGSAPIDVLRMGMPTNEFLKGTAILSNHATKPYRQGITRSEINPSLLAIYTRHWYSKGWVSKPPSFRRPQLGRSSLSVRKGILEGRVAVITGASSGIGAATAMALAKEGVHVALAARRVEALESIKNSLEPYGVKVLVQQTDVTDGEQVDTLVRVAAEELGPIDILVACAGVMYYTLMKNTEREQWERTVDVNCKGVLHCLSAIVPGMVSRGCGHIVAISSDAGRKVFAGLGVYSGSKFFVEATLQSLRLETVGTGLRVTSIQPGNVATELLGLSTDAEALKKYGEPSGAKVLDAKDVANAIVYALRQPEQVSVNEILIQPRDEPN